MFSLSTPSWLAGLGALVIPIALHLWNRRPSRSVRIGSLDHLAGAPGPTAWGGKLDDLPLLALRLAILAACVVGLAGPKWIAEAESSETSRILVLADSALVADSLSFYSDPLVDSLRRSQTQIHLLADGLPQLGVLGGATVPAARMGPTLWASLAELDRQLPAEQALLIIARAPAGELGPGRPQLGRGIRWYTPMGPSQVSERVIASWQISPDSAVELIEHPSGLATARFLRPTARAARAEVLGSEPGPITGGKLNDNSASFMFVQLVQSEQDSGVYLGLEAALHAALLSTQGFVPGSSLTLPPDGQRRGIIVWLGVQSVSEPVLATVSSGAWLLQFVPANRGADQVPDSDPMPRPQTAGWNTYLPPDLPGAAIVADHAGRPLVTAQAHGSGRWIRIGLAPGGLEALAVGDPSLAVLLHHLLSPDRPSDAAPVHPSQATPSQQRVVSAAVGSSTDWAPPLLWLALLLLMGERLTAHRRRRRRP